MRPSDDLNGFSSVYFQRIVIASPASLQLSIVLSTSAIKSLGGKPAIKVNSRPLLTSSAFCCAINVSKKAVRGAMVTIAPACLEYLKTENLEYGTALNLQQERHK